MTINDAILAVVGASRDEGVKGRTLVQKKLYFLSVLTDQDFGFAPHYFGPYSSLVAGQLGALVEAGFVHEGLDVFPGRRGRFGETRRYTYQLTPEGRQVLDLIERDDAGWLEAIERINSHQISDDVDRLSIAAKVHYILREHGDPTIGEIRGYAEELGWDVSEGDIAAVTEYLERLHLVEAG